MFLNKYLDKVFSAMDEMDKVKKPTIVEAPKNKKYCGSFVKGEDGFCIHYKGSRVDIVSCARECSRE